MQSKTMKTVTALLLAFLMLIPVQLGGTTRAEFQAGIDPELLERMEGFDGPFPVYIWEQIDEPMDFRRK